MMAPCDVVAERLALDEPLAELTQHADDCPRCQGLLAAQRSLTAGRRGDATPAHGFASRMTVAANQRLAVRHRRRVAGYAMLSAAVAALVTFVVMRDPAKASQPPAVGASQPVEPGPEEALRDPWKAPAEEPREMRDEPSPPDEPSPEESSGPDDEAYLLRVLSQTSDAPLSADWKKIEAPLSRYDHLLQQVGEP